MQLNINSFFGLLWSGLFYFQPHPRLLPCLTILRWPISQGTHHLVWQVAQFRRCLVLHGTTRTPTDPYDMVAGLSMVYSFSLEETNLPSIYRKRDKLYLSCMEQMGKKPNLENQIREKMRVVEMIRKKPLFAFYPDQLTNHQSIPYLAKGGNLTGFPHIPRFPSYPDFGEKSPRSKGSHSTIPITGSWPLKPTMSDLHVVFATVAGRCDDPSHQMVPVAQKSSKK